VTGCRCRGSEVDATEVAVPDAEVAGTSEVAGVEVAGIETQRLPAHWDCRCHSGYRCSDYRCRGSEVAGTEVPGAVVPAAGNSERNYRVLGANYSSRNGRDFRVLG
jgi:hypothetical protein